MFDVSQILLWILDIIWLGVMLLCSHRPVDVHNIYNQVQVKMLMKEDDCENIPAFEDVFRDEDDEEEQEEVGFAGGFVKSVCIMST